MSKALTQAELTILQSPMSNDCRVLYLLGLRPTANFATTSSSPIDYKQLLSLLNGEAKENTYQRGRQINSLLKQLELTGLVIFPEGMDLEHSINGKTVLLPLIIESKNNFDSLHKIHYSITTSWQPNKDLFEEMAQLLGIIDTEYDDNDVGEFIAYWLGRPTTILSEFQWTQKFAHNIKHKRISSGYTPVRKIGNQTVKVAAGIEADDNAKKLVEKYSASTKKS